MQKTLNIVSGNLPSPNTLGDGQQTYWLLEALSAAGIEIHLYTFSESDSTTEANSDPKIGAELSKMCSSVKTYPINLGHRNFSISAPYATGKFMNQQLIQDLSSDQHPILIEGMGPCGLALSSALEHRKPS